MELDGTPKQGFQPSASPASSYTPSVYSPQSAGTSRLNSSRQPSLSIMPSGIPRLPFRTANIPESDEERESRLDRDRQPILDSQNFEDQLGWAQDALSFVDSLADQELRLSFVQPPRPATPPVERQLRIDAMNIVEHMSTQRHPRALFMKGMWLEFGKFGFAEDRKEAFRLYKSAAVNGYHRAEYRMGMLFESTNEPVQALQHYRAGEAAGDAASCYRMGMIAALGQLGQPQDFGRAVNLIRYAADYADDNAPQAAFVFGMLLSRDLPQIKIPDSYLALDVIAGKGYTERAAFLGFSKAQWKMGQAYELCALHCEFNPALSMHYNALAARQGEAEAELAISKWFICGHEGLFQKNEELAFKYAQRAAQQGLPTAEFAMGYFYEIGWYQPKNISLAQEWYQKAAQSGNKEANDGLQRLSSSNALSMRDHEKVTMPRIKSTHGSQRGNRPPRLQRPANQMNTVHETTSPPPLKPPPAPLEQRHTQPYGSMPPRPGTTDPLPPRSSSVAPYPMEDRPATVAPQAPYPGGPAQYPPSHSHSPPVPPGGPYYHPPPSNPNFNRPVSEVVDPRSNPSHPSNHYPPGPAPMQHPPPMRSYHSAADMSAARQHPPPGGQYYQSGPPPQSGYYRRSPSPQPPMRPPKEPHQPSPQSMHPPPNAFSPAPSVRPVPSRPGLASRHSQDSHASSQTSSHNSVVASARPDSMRPNSRPGSSHSNRPAVAAARPAASGKPGAPAGGSKAPSGRPGGKGPKTFDEMGVNIAKNDGECVSFPTSPFSHSLAREANETSTECYVKEVPVGSSCVGLIWLV